MRLACEVTRAAGDAARKRIVMLIRRARLLLADARLEGTAITTEKSNLPKTHPANSFVRGERIAWPNNWLGN
jgi:hypothetical protein